MNLSRVFVANRGEIAVRVLRACRKLELSSVIGVSEADQESTGAMMADRAIVIGPAPSKDSYLKPDLIVSAAVNSGCDALHPGYGFLSERGELAEMCAENGIAFVGPTADTIRKVGDKISARELARAAGVPLVPGSGEVSTVEQAKSAASDVGYPIVLKATAGGGGRGMAVARADEDIARTFDAASLEAEEAFGDGTLYVERFVENARHVEVQILGDGKGNVLHFGDRDCSAQRRYQKVVEEAPATAVPDDIRTNMREAAVRLAKSINYRNAGTVEFLYDQNHNAFYFIEVNARIQVEHPVTEEITGVDLVVAQLKIAAGEPLGLTQDMIALSGHAIECRINAEMPLRDFAPSPGRITAWLPPEGDGVRVDSHCEQG
ncbi:MAG TPA: ATP-grasp domain-containing protein, partial [Sneathiellales bacterium]|nr:ATP-grasp domain-containing protein [Sneathiellales bacterium]